MSGIFINGVRINTGNMVNGVSVLNFTERKKITASGKTIKQDNVHVVGNNNKIEGRNVKVEGNSNTVTGACALVIGNANKVSGPGPHVTGKHNIVSGPGATVKGNHNNVSGPGYNVNGDNNTASGVGGVMQGNGNIKEGSEGGIQVSVSNRGGFVVGRQIGGSIVNNFGSHVINNAGIQSQHRNDGPSIEDIFDVVFNANPNRNVANKDNAVNRDRDRNEPTDVKDIANAPVENSNAKPRKGEKLCTICEDKVADVIAHNFGHKKFCGPCILKYMTYDTSINKETGKAICPHCRKDVNKFGKVYD